MRRLVSLIAALALAGGCGGGVFIPPPSITVGTLSVRFDTADEFYALPGVADLLARSGVTPALGDYPPPLAGEYDAQGAVLHDDYDPEAQGVPVGQLLRFFDLDADRIGFSLDGALGSFTDGAGRTTKAIVTGSGDAFTVHFHVRLFQEREVFGADLGCFESRVGVVHGTRLPDGTLEVTVASVTTGLEGRWVAMLKGDGVTDDEMVGSLRVLGLTASDRVLSGRPDLQSLGHAGVGPLRNPKDREE